MKVQNGVLMRTQKKHGNTKYSDSDLIALIEVGDKGKGTKRSPSEDEAYDDGEDSDKPTPAKKQKTWY